MASVCLAKIKEPISKMEVPL